jgi:two-component system, OmpR family, sensor histidine kinase CpxA
MKSLWNKLAQSLSARIIGLAFLNLALLLVVLAYSVRSIYRTDVGSFVFAPIADRILSVSRFISFDLLENNSESWDSILAKYSAGTPLRFYLFDGKGRQIAGDRVALPPSLQSWTRNVDASLSYSPRWNSNDRPDSQRGVGVFFMKREGKPKNYWAATHVLIHYPDMDMYGHATLVWRFSSLWTSSYFVNLWPYLGMIAAVVLVTLLCWLPVARNLLTAFSKLTRATGQIAQGNFAVELPTDRSDEVGQLSRSVAGMAEQLSGLVNQQRRFVSDAAHELCSPTSRMQVLLAIIEQQEGSGCERYIDDLKEEAQQMAQLVSDLLSFSKSELTVSDAPLEPIELSSLISTVVEQELTGQNVIQQKVPQGITVYAVPSHLRRAIANLLRNAQKYAGAYGPIEVVAEPDGDDILIAVRDQGPGLAPEDLEAIFRPFYRPEFARTRETGGTGLGLAIVQNCIEACHGSVRCQNRLPRGLSVEIKLPRALPERPPSRARDLQLQGQA